MSSATEQAIREALSDFRDRYLESDLTSTKSVKAIRCENGSSRVEIVLGFPAAGYAAELSQQLRVKLSHIPDIGDLDIDISYKVASHAVQSNVELLKNVKNVIAVASGKGGVGKSTVAVNLALALQAEGATVGVLDADIYGPSQPRMLGASGQPDSKDGKSLEPMMSHGIQSMSIGYLIDEETPMIWRGPMVTQALEQLLKDTCWRDIDYLVVDLPPGTGDIQLTLAQKIPVSGAVIVTTPQDIALLDARKGLKMFDKVKVPVLGVIENMSIHVCSNCGHEEHIFGSGGGERIAEENDVAMLGALPLDRSIRENVDSGTPSMVKDPGGRIASQFKDIARRVAARLSRQGKDYSQAFPSIVIQND